MGKTSSIMDKGARYGPTTEASMDPFSIAAFQSFRKHFVTMSCVQRRTGNATEIARVFSGFVIDIEGHWFYATAGHIVSDIRRAIECGSEFTTWRLGDQLGQSKAGTRAIPFEFELDRWRVLYNKRLGFDYAALPLDFLYRLGLEEGGVEAIKRSAWGWPQQPHKRWFVVGVPSETVKFDGDTELRAQMVMLPMDQVEAPVAAEGMERRWFYAKLTEASEDFARDVDGMSGGPIFSVMQDDDGDFHYRVIGVQSAWYRSRRIVAFAPIAAYANALAATLSLQPSST